MRALVKPATVIRSIIFYILAALLSLPFVVIFPFVFIVPRQAAWPFIAAFLRGLLFLLKHVCGLGFEIHGIETIPEGPVLLASRHESIWEVLFFPLFFGNPAAFAKQEIFRYPFAGAIARRGGHISIDRSGDMEALRVALNTAKQRVDSGRSILIFPSGTRREDGRSDIKAGVGALYGLLRIPCVPIVLDSARYWPGDSWWQSPGTIVVRILPAIGPASGRREFLEILQKKLNEPASPPLA